MNEQKTQYLQFIQDIITRHNANSFQIKGWTIALITATDWLYATKEAIEFIIILILLILSSWLLDAIYLKQERQYRSLFDDAVKDKTQIYDLNAQAYKQRYICAMFSETLRWFYPLLIAFQFALLCILNCK